MVEENEYRSTYQAINQHRCQFEKAVLSRRCDCICSTRFYLADREGIACDSSSGAQRCKKFLNLLRENARFALKLTSISQELPHTKEIKIQHGGLLGLQRVLQPDLGNYEQIDNIAGLTSLGEQRFGSLEQFPYQEIIKSVVSFQGRRRPRSKR